MHNEVLEERFRRLEQNSRRLKGAYFAVGCVVAIAALLGARQPPETLDEIRTRRLVVVDAEGRERIIYDAVYNEASKRPRSMMQFYDANHMPLMAFGAYEYDGTSFAAFRDPSGKDRIVLFNGHNDGHARIFLNDARPKNRAQVYTQPSNLAGVQAMNVRGPWQEINAAFDPPQPPRKRKRK